MGVRKNSIRSVAASSGGYSSPQRRLPASLQRAKVFGPANQLSYEANETFERNAMKARLAAQRKRSMARAAAKPTDPSGLSSGVMGGSLRAQYMSMSKDKGKSVKHLYGTR